MECQIQDGKMPKMQIYSVSHKKLKKMKSVIRKINSPPFLVVVDKVAELHEVSLFSCCFPGLSGDQSFVVWTENLHFLQTSNLWLT